MVPAIYTYSAPHRLFPHCRPSSDFPSDMQLSSSPALEEEIAMAVKALSEVDIALAEAIVEAHTDGMNISLNAPLLRDIK